MKNIIICYFFLAIVSLPFSLAGQERSVENSDINQVFPGYVQFNNGDSVMGYLLFEGRAENQAQVTFFSDLKDKKRRKTYGPGEIQGYKIAGNYYKSMHYGDIFNRKKYFLLRTAGGRISRYVFYWFDMELKEWKEEEVLQKGDEKPVGPFKLLSFAKTMSEMTKDHPELSSKISNREPGYNIFNLYEIINEYNDWYSRK